jgi:general secretion pathway protein D
MARVLVSGVAALILATATAFAQAPEESPAAAPTLEPGAAPAATVEGDDSVVLNFESADIREVIHSLADALRINYQIDPRIQGQVTIRTTGPIAKEDLFPVFNQILRSNGIAATRVGDIYQIIPVAEAKTKAIIPVTPGETRRVRAQDAFVIEVVRVEHVAVQEMVNVVQPFITPGGDVIPYPRANLLIITDLESNVGRLKDLVATFDRDAFRDLRARVYKIEHANIEELGQELIAIMDTYGVTPASAEERGVYIIPLPRLSSVVVVAFNPTAFAEIDRWLKVLDVPPEEGVGRSVHVYAVENAKAADLAVILNELYGGGTGGRATATAQQYTPFGTRQRTTAAAAPAVRPQTPQEIQAARRAQQQQQQRRPGLQSYDGFDELEPFVPLQQFDGGLGRTGRGTTARGGRGGVGASRGVGGAGGLGGLGVGGGAAQGATGYVLAGGEPGDIFREEVRIVADDITNSLVVLATQKDYDDILGVLRRLDVVPRQVLVEVLVAEVMLGDDLRFGVEWALAEQSRKGALGRLTGETTTGEGEQQTSATNVFDIGGALGLRSPEVVPIPGSGSFAFLSDNRNFAVVLNALAAKNKLKVLSAPHIMTADNHEAHILVGQEVPIVTTQTTAADVQVQGTSSFLQNIQYRDTGVILTVLPQVNSAGLVNMQIRQEVSTISEMSVQGISSPTFNTRQSETTVVVQSGETIVISGIIDDAVNQVRSGIPFLMDIPVLGRAFRVERENFVRVELVVLLTPHVVRDRQESHAATEGFLTRLQGLRRDVERYDRERPDYGGPKPPPLPERRPAPGAESP